ncbi:hypothetical protein BS17DRAFT_788633 [Gyrodon lividus]|nr:hypothetical protein BS17DRAFT_788633 [Gyrodon lividus]
MLVMAGKRGKLASTTDPEYETRIQLDCIYTHQSCHAAAQSQQILNDAQENAVNKWLILNSGMAAPLHPHNLCACAYDSFRKRSAAVPDHATQQQQASFISPSPSTYLPSGYTLKFPQYPLYECHHVFSSSSGNLVPHTRSPLQISYVAPGPSMNYTYECYHENQTN